jgi:TonB family protein
MKCFWVSVTFHICLMIFIMFYPSHLDLSRPRIMDVAVTYLSRPRISEKIEKGESLVKKDLSNKPKNKRKAHVREVLPHTRSREEMAQLVSDASVQSNASRLDGSSSGLIFRPTPQLINEVTVPYPEKARQMMIEGVVRLRLTVSKRGNVVNAQILSGPAFGLRNAALDVVKKLSFLPATDGYGEAREAEIDHEVVFSLQ